MEHWEASAACIDAGLLTVQRRAVPGYGWNMHPRPATIRYVWAGLGLLFVGLGTLGMVLPLLPTTPFLVLALWCFSRSSPRLEHWLFTHRRFGPPLQRWRHHRVVPLPVKLTAYTSMAGSLSLMALKGTPWPLMLVSALVMAYGVWFLARCPSHAPGSDPGVKETAPDAPPIPEGSEGLR